VIVRDRGDSWQVVMQTDHADLSAGFARAWAEVRPRHESLTIAAERHDDGWAVWEQSPRGGADGTPVNFLDVDVRSHLAFYRAGIEAVREQDAYAGLLVSMHGAGIYRRRYGRDPGLSLSRAQEEQALVEAFVDEQEAAFEQRMAEAGVEDEERWRDYELLQVFDRFSLYFCMRDAENGVPEPVDVQGYTLEGIGPWRVRMTPFPFGDDSATFSLVRRVLAKSGEAEVLAAAPEMIAITIES
jgi:hypothetical protein